MNETERAIKELIIEALNLEDLSPDDIESEAPLFGDGLGLDSIDALELGVAIRRKYGVNLDIDTDEIRDHFASVASLARFVTAAGHQDR
jgi:acyl carrier protein